MTFKYTQPKTENDIKCNGDCMVRAVTIATNFEYGKVHKPEETCWRTGLHGLG